MGVCVVAAAALLSLIADEGHRVLPSHLELSIGAEAAMDNADKLVDLMLDDDYVVAEEPPTEGGELCAALREDVTTKVFAAFGLAHDATCTYQS